ncbi:unnamed protein product, partial [Prorocentrum cordatum]
MNQANRDIVMEFTTHIRTQKLPYLIAGDWNALPEDLEKPMKWLSWVRGVVVTPENATWTCSNGHRMLDYFVVDQRLALDASLTAVLEGPWRPRLGQCAQLLRRPLLPPEPQTGLATSDANRWQVTVARVQDRDHFLRRPGPHAQAFALQALLNRINPDLRWPEYVDPEIKRVSLEYFTGQFSDLEVFEANFQIG